MPGFQFIPGGPAMIPPLTLQSVRTQKAVDAGVEKNLLFKTWGGLGDQICAEPTIRFALKTFEGCTITVASEHPELFEHLPLHALIDLKRKTPSWDQYLCFDTIVSPEHVLWEFVSHMTTHCVDFPSICAFRSQLPIADRELGILLPGELLERVREKLNSVSMAPWVAVHPGRHWQSKTFPIDWWNQVISNLTHVGVVPVIIGANTDDNRGTVSVDTTGCLDLRNELSVLESIGLLQLAPVLLTNDSAPLHMAATGNAWIGFVATCKHPDYITHWRRGSFGWRMVNLGLGGIWDVLDFCPNVENKVEVENVGDELLRSWLPDPASVATWAYERL